MTDVCMDLFQMIVSRTDWELVWMLLPGGSKPIVIMLVMINSKHVIWLFLTSEPGDDGAVEPPELGGVGEAEAAGSGTPALPGEPVAEGRAGRDAAEAAEERAERRPAGGGEEAPGVHEPAQEVRWGRLPHCEYFERLQTNSMSTTWSRFYSSEIETSMSLPCFVCCV